MSEDECLKQFRDLITDIRSFEDRESDYFKGWCTCWNIFRIEFNAKFGNKIEPIKANESK